MDRTYVNLAALAPATPGRAARLDLARLRGDLRILGRLAWAYKQDRNDRQRRGSGTAYEDGQLRRLRERITDLCVLRAAHRGRVAVARRRVFGPGLPNGTAILEWSPPVKTDLATRYERVADRVGA